jgi:hypothetical protein
VNKALVFISGVLCGAVLGIAGLLGWASTKLTPKLAHTPSHFQDFAVDRLPFQGEWLVFWGGETKSENHHYGVAPQNLAMDILKTVANTGVTFEGDRKKNESYACWAQPIYAPVDGIVAVAVDGIPDNTPGEMNPHMVSGNCLMIQSKTGVVVLCHFKNGSVAKKQGDTVKVGELLGLCGNSGNSSEPHLHFHIQSDVGFVRGEAMRPVFAEIAVAGVNRRDYSPRKGDRVSNPAREPNKPF